MGCEGKAVAEARRGPAAQWLGTCKRGRGQGSQGRVKGATPDSARVCCRPHPTPTLPIVGTWAGAGHTTLSGPPCPTPSPDVAPRARANQRGRRAGQVPGRHLRAENLWDALTLLFRPLPNLHCRQPSREA
ncbi:unnamed protein product [Rangifer tarandus platyrhynchus]|uniref:Uncharacterized protein n=1 Tax=Rangifer tarandus platyrhynchus TaxID=3082113 RepID=A0ABN8ZI46_RANTA|nr:unnamed protein product [Rangifer tarandus platyrhynchus]